MTELGRIKAMLNHVEAKYRNALLDFVREAKSEDSVNAILELLEQGRVNEAIAYVENFTTGFGAVTLAAMLVAANLEVGLTLPQIDNSVGVAFDPTDEQAALIVRNTGARFIQQINSSQRESIQEALIQAQLRGLTISETAQQIRNSIGLTRKQIRAVENYESLLREGSMEALNRDLRDRRSDRAVTGKRPLSEKQIRSMVDRYRARYIAYRALTISRTEANRAANAARHEALRQLVDKAGIDHRNVRRTWQAVKDERTRRTHKPHSGMDGQEVGLDEPFVSPSGAKLMFPGDTSLGAPAAEIVNCRCTTITRIEQ